MKIFSQWALMPFRHATLFRSFVRQEIRGRYAGSFGGLTWTLLLPIANMLIYIFVFSVVLKMRLRPQETGTSSFVIFLMAGLLPWLAFSEALMSASSTFVGRANLITKVSFPIQLLPLTGVTVAFLLNGVGLLIFLGYLAIFGYASLAWLWLLPVVALHVVFTLGLVILVASLSVFIRDMAQVMTVVMALWLYLTPILYPVSMVPARFRWFIVLNPMYPFIQLYHQVLLQQRFDWVLAAGAASVAVLFFAAGVIFFSRAHRAFADVL